MRRRTTKLGDTVWTHVDSLGRECITTETDGSGPSLEATMELELLPDPGGLDALTKYQSRSK